MSVVLRTGRALRRLVQVATARPALTVVVSLLLAAAGVVYSLQELTFITSGKDLLPCGRAYVQRYAEDSREFADPDQIVVAVQAPRLALAKAYASQVAHELRKYPDRFERDRKSTRLNSSHSQISYAVFCLKKKIIVGHLQQPDTRTT